MAGRDEEQDQWTQDMLPMFFGMYALVSALSENRERANYVSRLLSTSARSCHPDAKTRPWMLALAAFARAQSEKPAREKPYECALSEDDLPANWDQFVRSLSGPQDPIEH